MADKINIQTLDSISANDAAAVLTINNNFKTVQEAINNTLSRDGTVPNFMDADIDLNTHKLINGADPVDDKDYVTLGFLNERIGNASEAVDLAELAASRAESSASSAAISASNAQTSATSASTSAQFAYDVAKGFDAHAQEIKDELDAIAQNAQGSEAAAAQSAANAKASEDAALESANNAEADATNAAESADVASQAKTNASESAAAAHDSAGKAFTSETNAAISEQNAAESETNAANSADLAESWAIGDIASRPQGSAKYWAENAKALTDGALNETQITNCITKITQDIKLELSNGTLTLKAGSKVYVPNGVGVFDIKTINTDITLSSLWNMSGKNMLFYRANNNLTSIGILSLNSNVWSGDNPTIDRQYGYWYDITNNYVKYTEDTGGSWYSGQSLPLAIVSGNGSKITSIDQVFNGFGYIGNTVFALPGVEGLIPNGRNADGSLNNIKVTTTSVSQITSSMSTSNYDICLSSTGSIDNWSIARYDEDKNIIYREDNNSQVFLCLCGKVARNSGQVTAFNPKNVIKLSDDQDVVHKDRDEEITGKKTFSTTILSNVNHRCFQRNGRDNKVVMTLESNDDGNSNKALLFAFSEDGGSNINLTLNYNNGSPYAYFSNNYTLADFDKTKKVATTEFVGKHGISASGENYVKLGDGTIIQWGTYASTTFAKPFANTDYTLIISPIESQQSQMYSSPWWVKSKTTTNWSSDSTPKYWLAIGKGV